MALTHTQNNPLNTMRLVTGTFLEDDTAVAITVTCGFQPRYVRVQNETSRDGMEWFQGMADAEAVKTVAAGTRTLITTLGITVTSSGFTIGLDTDVNVVNEQISYYAIG